MLIDNCSSIWNLIYCWPSDVCCIQLCQMIHVECICILWVFMKVDAIIPIASELFEMSDKFLNIYLKCKPIIVVTMWSLVVSIIVQEDSSEPFLVIKKGERVWSERANVDSLLPSCLYHVESIKIVFSYNSLVLVASFTLRYNTSLIVHGVYIYLWSMVWLALYRLQESTKLQACISHPYI